MIETFERVWDLADIEINRSGDGRTVTAYAAVFDQDAEISDQHGQYVERISRTAFNRTIGMGNLARIGVLYNHGYDASGRPNMVGAVPIGTPLDIKADARGLLTVTRYNKSQMADAVLEAIRDGQIKGQSFRGRIIHSDEAQRAGRRHITRTELGLREYGPTPSPAYHGAEILALRSQDAGALEEMVRKIVASTSGHAAGPATEPATEDSALRHSRTIHVLRNRARLNAGVIGGKAEDQSAARD